ncbi:unnamed protein product [Blepharisma stoltei]|uniref:Uncharacterized protein n=1 Tax=Blepharisma stoltei TaxID=1481888 RepID=A0AAU9JYU5_9CILI|nr:unnamed protein product [Blepharisma stoltei]
MLLTFFSILALSYSLSLINELGSLYLTSGESQRLSLSDYFSGNNLSFSITNSNTTQNSTKINFRQELKLHSFTPYQNPAWNKTWHLSNQQNVFIKEEYEREVLFSYNENYLIFYQLIKEASEVSLLYAVNIESPYNNSRIMGIRYRERYHPTLIIWVVGEESNHSAFTLRNDIYILNITDLHYLTSPVWSNFSEITYASKIILGDGEVRDFFSIFCKFEEGPSTLAIYDIKNIYEPVLYQKISQYDKIQIPSNQIAILSIFMAEYAFSVLDQSYGLISYRHDWLSMSFLETENFDLRPFGSLYSMQPLHDLTLSVATKSGAVILKFTAAAAAVTILGVINPGKSIDTESVYIQSTHLYYYIQANNGILSIVLKEKSNFDILCSFDLERMIGNNYENNGIFEVYTNIINGHNYYARFDRDGIRAYLVDIEEWTLEVWGNTNYFIEITAEDQEGHKVSSVLNIISIPSDSKEILPLDHYREAKIFPKSSSFIGNSAPLNFIVNSFFSGPNLSFKIEASHSELFSLDFVAPSKLILSQNISISDDVTKVFIYGAYLVEFYPDKVAIDKGDYINGRSYNVSNPIAFLHTSQSFSLIYSKPSENFYLISYFNHDYYAPQSLLQAIESQIECKFFDLADSFLFCADNTQIDIYLYEDDLWNLTFSLTGRSFNEGFSWNLIDVEFSLDLLHDYLYLLDEEKGILMISIRMLFMSRYSSMFYYEKSIKENKGLIQIVPLTKYVSFINKNGWIDIYDYPLTYLRRIFLDIPSGPISNIVADSSLIYIQLENSIYIYDIDQPSHNALFYIFKSSLLNTISYGAYLNCLSCLGSFFSSANGKYLEIYSVPCSAHTNDLNNCKYELVTTFLTKKKKLSENVYPVNIAVTAYNENSSLTQHFPINLITSGLFIRFKPNQWKVKDTIPYDERYEINLDDVFVGQNMTMELNINGKIIDKAEMKTPALLQKRSEQVGLYQSKTHLYSHIPITNNLVIITSESGFLVANSTEFFDAPLYLNISEITGLSSLICKLIDWFPYSKNNQTLFVTSCSYQMYQTSSAINRPFDNPLEITALSLILWQFDYLSLSITQFKIINTMIMPDFLRLAPLDENSFEIMALSKMKFSENTNNEIFRFRGSWLENHIEIKQVEIINFFTLNLLNFYTKLLDFKVKNSEDVYWYAFDEYYGIRIIETSRHNSSMVVGGLPNSIDSSFISLGICQDFLLVSSYGKGIESYRIKNDADLEQDATYYFFLEQSSYSAPIQGIIACSEDFRFIAAPIYRAFGEASLAIWDRKASNASNSISITHFSQCTNSYPGGDVKFIDKNTLSTLGCNEKLYTSYRFNENKLIFPDFSEDEYFDMTEEWGTKDFRLCVVAKNGNDEEISSIVYFRREGPESNESPLWVWVVLSVGIASVFVGGIYGIIKVLKAKKNKNMKSFLMQELRRGDEVEN